MKKSISILIIFFFVTSIGIIHAQNLDEILEKHFEATGQNKLENVEAYSVKAKISQMGMEIPMEIQLKRPDKYKMEMDIMGQKMIQVYNGEKGWVLAPQLGSDPVELTGVELDQVVASADIDGELYNYKEKGTQLELVGKENIDGTDMYNLKLTDKNGNERNYYIDANTYLIGQTKAKTVSMGQEINTTQKMVEYKDFDGIKIATKIVSETPMGNAEIEMEEVNLNPEIDDSAFEKPSN